MAISLDEQIQALLEGAPQDGKTPILIQVIAPILIEIAQQLQCQEYYILQNPEGRWMMTTLSHREDLQPDKTVIYAYGTLEDAKHNPQARSQADVMAVPTPVINVLFQLLALQPVSSILFFDVPGNPKQAMEIRRGELQALVRAQLKAYQEQRENLA